jgi:hypothetical protein
MLFFFIVFPHFIGNILADSKMKVFLISALFSIKAL